MGGNRDKAESGTRGKGGAASRKERLAQALRANLKRRKQPETARANGADPKKTGGWSDTGS